MSAQISDGTTIITPSSLAGFSSTRSSQTRQHEVPGSVWPDMVLRPAGPRTGTFVFRFTAADAQVASLEAEELHQTGMPLTFTRPGFSTIDMTYVLAPGGRLQRELDPDTKRFWTLTVDYMEVQP